MLIDSVSLVKQLVAIPSVSPMASNAPPEILGESRLTAFLEKTFREIGLTTWRQPAFPGRENLVARLDGDVPPEKGGPVLLLDAHQDTVPVAGMTVAPFDPVERDGRIYGRGSCDTKGGMAAAITAVARLVHEGIHPRPTVLISCTVDEESGFGGVLQLTKLWDSLPGLPRPSAAIVLEPTGLDVAVAHKGMVRWRMHAIGRAAHSSRPQAGDNAIYKMARVVTAIEQYAAQLAAGRLDPRCGLATVSVGTIHGGVGVNTVPDRCTIEVDLRPLPGDDLLDARQQLLDATAGLHLSGIQSDPLFAQGPSLSDQRNGPLSEQLLALVRETAGPHWRTGLSCGTNAPFFASLGIPTVVFGPGFLDQAHTADEWLPIEQLHAAENILYRLCRHFGDQRLSAAGGI
ncbi:MAG: M20 family metallopeptidase [Thermoguttaceae bacterium]